MRTIAYDRTRAPLTDGERKSLELTSTHQFFPGEFLIAPDAPFFSIRMERCEASPMPILFMQSSITSSYRRTAGHIRQRSADLFLLWLIESGTLKTVQPSLTQITPGGFLTVTRSDTAFFQQSSPGADQWFRAKIALLPGHLFRSHVPGCDGFFGKPVPATIGQGRVARDIINLLYEEDDRIALPARERLIGEVMNAIRDLSTDPALGLRCRLTVKEERQQQIHAYIRLNLLDPGLSAEKIASHFNISKRYLYLIFQDSGTTFVKFVIRKRLERSMELLRSREMRHFNIGDIADIVGFHSASHFSRSFKAAFGCSPRDFQRHSMNLLPAPATRQ